MGLGAAATRLPYFASRDPDSRKAVVLLIEFLGTGRLYNRESPSPTPRKDTLSYVPNSQVHRARVDGNTPNDPRTKLMATDGDWN